MITNNATEPQVSTKNAKNEILAAYEGLLKKVQENLSGVSENSQENRKEIPSLKLF